MPPADLHMAWNCPFLEYYNLTNNRTSLALISHVSGSATYCAAVRLAKILLWGNLTFQALTALHKLMIVLSLDGFYTGILSPLTTACRLLTASLCFAEATALSRVRSGSICNFSDRFVSL